MNSLSEPSPKNNRPTGKADPPRPHSSVPLVPPPLSVKPHDIPVVTVDRAAWRMEIHDTAGWLPKLFLLSSPHWAGSLTLLAGDLHSFPKIRDKAIERKHVVLGEQFKRDWLGYRDGMKRVEGLAKPVIESAPVVREKEVPRHV